MSQRKHKKKVSVEQLQELDVDENHGDEEELGLTDGELHHVNIQKKRGPTLMAKVSTAARWGKKTKIDYDDMGRPAYNANGRALQSYIGSIARSMVPINIKSWPDVPENIKQKVWEEISNVFEVAPESQSSVMSSAAQKWRDFKNKLTSRFVWPNRDNPEKLISPPSQYQLPIADWKEFVNARLDPSWEATHEKQKERTMHCRYHHKMSRKGYIGLEAELREKNIIAEDEVVDRSILWRKAREDKSGIITSPDTSEVAEKIDDLLEKNEKGEFKVSGMNDVLTTSLGSQEHHGRVRGVGGFVKPHVFFKTPRKKRESFQKTTTGNINEQLEETRLLKAELEKLKAQLASVLPIINDRSSEIVASNKSSEIQCPKQKQSKDMDPKLSKDLEDFYECGPPDMKGKKCHLAVKKCENVVAYGTVISEGGPNVMIHNVPLGEENFKVSVDVVLDETAMLPIPIKSGPTIVTDAIGAIVGWPKELVIFPKKKVL
ncbi:uncharacterized protein [Henckelia pumila]|uniref:uncharacterized protein n=1 Tax=Henckelia pumila TaxID=405737 RepID=UPI003C6E9A65